MEPHRCWAEIDLAAMAQNAQIAREAIAGEIMAILKANAYGHGLLPVAGVLATHAAFLGVATLAEALELRAHLGPAQPVFLLSPALPEERAAIVENGFVPGLSTLEEARDFNAIAGRLERKFNAHLVIDTGMGRMGFTDSSLPEFLAAHGSLAHLSISGIASHLSSADEDPAFTFEQIGRFEHHLETCVAAGLRPAWIHLANSAGILGFAGHLPETGDGTRRLARPGLMLYGVSPLPEHQPKLTPALSLKTRVTLQRDLPRGSSISYGHTFRTTRDTTRTATLGVGYGDGYPRHLSSCEAGVDVLIRGRRCPLLGRVTMDQVVVDVSGLPEPPRAGEEAVLIGGQGEETITATELAGKGGTIPWEIFTGITARVPRIYLRSSDSTAT